MFPKPPLLDRYIFSQVLATMGGVLAIVMSLMVLEHLPRLIEITRWSGRRGEVIGQTVIGLLPEYAGIGVMVGLFLGIGLTVRKLALRGELDVLAACGVSARRSMRLSALLAVLVALATLLNQGWLMPAGERRLAEIGQEVRRGTFGQRLPAERFVDLGSGAVLYFSGYDEETGELLGLFLKADGRVLSAARGRMWMSRSGGAELDLNDGQILYADDRRVLEFAALRQQIGALQTAQAGAQAAARLDQMDIVTLWTGGTAAERAAVYGRCLIALLMLALPVLASVLGKPPRRSAGAFGLLVGLMLLVGALKLVSSLTAGQASHPEATAAAIASLGAIIIFAFVKGEQAFGQGFVDGWAKVALTRWHHMLRAIHSDGTSVQQRVRRALLPVARSR